MGYSTFGSPASGSLIEIVASGSSEIVQKFLRRFFVYIYHGIQKYWRHFTCDSTCEIFEYWHLIEKAATFVNYYQNNNFT